MSRLIFFLWIPSFLLSQNLIDLEELAQDWVIETRRIVIPEYSHALNPSILKISKEQIPDAPGTYLLSFAPFPVSIFVGFVWLNEDFKVVSKPQVIAMQNPSRPQDSRLIAVGKEIYIVYNDLSFASSRRRRLHIAKILFEKNKLSLGFIEGMYHFVKEDPLRHEKNWVPFTYQDRLFFSYSLVPHQVLYPLLEKSETCDTFSFTDSLVDWPWGPIRGGTPALRIGEEYLAFFHSSCKLASVQSEGALIQHYFMGAYTFSKTPPFALTKISPSPIIARSFYQEEASKKKFPARVIFPCGYVYDEKYIWIVYGKQDHELWICRIDKERLLHSLIPVYENNLGEP